MLVVHDDNAALQSSQSFSIVAKGDWDALLLTCPCLSSAKGLQPRTSVRRRHLSQDLSASLGACPHLDEGSLIVLEAAQIKVNVWKVNVKLQSSCDWHETISSFLPFISLPSPTYDSGLVHGHRLDRDFGLTFHSAMTCAAEWQVIHP